ncbi:hypothetical protein [uncultured Ruegeria sp.]|uniref:hypothetical protein n=1 Tax=uncultured Ruegeria sp. TaxID=259304 RepID=UPI0026286717|nr:hypothetical protein [uncultured Ruegeria sp.]
MATVRNALSRKTDAKVLSELLYEISVEISGITQTNTLDLRDNDTESEGHKEDSLSPGVKEEQLSQIQVFAGQMGGSFPRLCSELRFGRDQVLPFADNMFPAPISCMW